MKNCQNCGYTTSTNSQVGSVTAACSDSSRIVGSDSKEHSCSILAMKRVIARLRTRNRLHSDRILTIPISYIIRSRVAGVLNQKKQL